MFACSSLQTLGSGAQCGVPTLSVWFLAKLPLFVEQILWVGQYIEALKRPNLLVSVVLRNIAPVCQSGNSMCEFTGAALSCSMVPTFWSASSFARIPHTCLNDLLPTCITRFLLKPTKFQSMASRLGCMLQCGHCLEIQLLARDSCHGVYREVPPPHVCH